MTILGIRIIGCFNRTFMELKYTKERTKQAGACSFNRTFMELKFVTVDTTFINHQF